MDAVVTRLHDALVEAVRRDRPGQTMLPITVAEIYQELVPYKSVRSALGVEMNADYEFALLRLLAGEGGFVRVEPAEVREALRLEIGSPNPNVALYREFAGCDVWLNMEDEDPLPALDIDKDMDLLAHLDIEDELDPLPPPRPRAKAKAAPSTFAFSDFTDDLDLTEDLNLADHLGIDLDDEVAEKEADKEDLRTLTGEVSDVPTCRFCYEQLPGKRKVNFCPFCGGDQRVITCVTCGEVVERDWRFCPACGTTVANGGSAATA